MTEQKLLELLGKFITNPVPEGSVVADIASDKMIELFDVRPFMHMGFAWVHSGSFRKWIGQNSGEWVSQKVLSKVLKKQGWVAEQGVKGIRINLWAIPMIKKQEVKDAKRSQSA